MLAVPPEFTSRYEARLAQWNIVAGQRPHYHKWLRLLLGFLPQARFRADGSPELVRANCAGASGFFPHLPSADDAFVGVGTRQPGITGLCFDARFFGAFPIRVDVRHFRPVPDRADLVPLQIVVDFDADHHDDMEKVIPVAGHPNGARIRQKPL